jgi:hypothetical protein
MVLSPPLVIPARGNPALFPTELAWIPAFAGMT